VPDRSLATYAVAGVKKEKSRITVHHACNATGSHKLPMWIVGSSKKPQCFKVAGLKIIEALGIRGGLISEKTRKVVFACPQA
jgi:hypothetical protein